MTGTRTGGWKAAKANLKNDPDFYRRIGAMGGRAISSTPKGFAANPEFASAMGKIGGSKSKRGVSMPDDVRKLHATKNYCKTRIRYYEKQLNTLTTDFAINQAEDNYDYWKNRLKQVEDKLKEMEQ